MACQNKKIQDIEMIIEERDSKFLQIHKNIDRYKDCVQELYTYFKINKNHINFKILFQKKLSSLSKRMKGLKVSKVYLVYVYQKMIKEQLIENDNIFWTFIQKNPSRNMSGVNSFAILLSPEPDGRT